jgi:hypothetical protein
MEIGQYMFYNAGKRINEHIQLDNPYNHDNDNACKSYFRLDAPEAAFFSIPSQVKIGEATVQVNFIEDILAKHGPRGLVLVNSNLPDDQVPEERPITNSKDKAVAKGNALWHAHLQSVANIHLNFCQESLAKGGKPMPAYGFTAFAMKELGITDPGSPASVVQSNHDEVAELKKQIADLTKLVTSKVGKG